MVQLQNTLKSRDEAVCPGDTNTYQEMFLLDRHQQMSRHPPTPCFA